MKVRYRILDERAPDGGWETIGVIIQWLSAPPHLQLSGIVHHTVSTSIWRVILERVRERQLTLESYHEAMGEFGDDYRLLPEIYEIEAATAAEIRHQLRAKYMYGQQVAPVPA